MPPWPEPDDTLVEVLAGPRNCQRAGKIMESLLGMANGQRQQREEVNVKTLVEEVFTGLCRDFTKDGITVETRVPEDLHLHCVPVQMQQVLIIWC
jgi:C4-dicarboxylate-specific signal transduction histidine kinase